MRLRRVVPSRDSPHSPCAVASGILGLVSAVGAAIPPARGLAGQWLRLIVSHVRRPAIEPAPEPAFSALYLIPFVIVLVCCVLAIILGVLAHVSAGLEQPPTGEQRRSQLATVGILGGGIGLWLLLRV